MMVKCRGQKPRSALALREREAVFTQRRQKRSGQHRVNAVIAIDDCVTRRLQAMLHSA